MVKLDDMLAEISNTDYLTLGGKSFKVLHCCAAADNENLKVNLTLKNEEECLVSVFIDAYATKPVLTDRVVILDTN